MEVTVRDVHTLDDLFEFQRWLSQPRSVLAYDIETTGFDWWGADRIRLAQFGDSRSAWVFSYAEWRGVVRDVFKSYTGPMVGHNFRFDLHFTAHDLGLSTDSLGWHRLHDTMTLAHLIDPTVPKGLKPLAAKHIDPAAVAGQQELNDDMRRGKWNWATVPLELKSYRFYAGLDTILTAQLFDKFYPYIMSKYPDAYGLEQVVSHPLFAMERHGMLLDRAYTERAQADLMIRAEDIAAEVHRDYGIDNISSLPQIRDSLLGSGWVPNEDQQTPTGNPSLRADVLDDIAHLFPLAHKVVQYRLATKAASTWLDNFMASQDETGRVHPNIRQVAARTGRMSITNPPLQTLPRESDARAKGLPSIRDCFVAPADHRLISADFSGIEARLFAHFAGEPEMIRTIHEGGDLHSLVASAAYQIDISEVTKDQRQIAKSVNFASLYGAGPARVAVTAGISEEESRDFFARRDVAFPGIRKFQRQIMDEAVAQRAMGERAHIRTHIGSKISITDEEPEYRLTNYLIQGSAAVVLKDRIISLHNAGLTDLMLLPIHDEVLFEVPVEDCVEVTALIKENMPDNSSFDVPLAIDVSEPVLRWGAAK